MLNRKTHTGRTTALVSTTLAISAIAITGCSKAAVDSGDPDMMTVSGSFNITGTGLRDSLSLSGLSAPGMSYLVNPTDYKVYCVTFTAQPSAGTGAVGSDHKFSTSFLGKNKK